MDSNRSAKDILNEVIKEFRKVKIELHLQSLLVKMNIAKQLEKTAKKASENIATVLQDEASRTLNEIKEKINASSYPGLDSESSTQNEFHSNRC